MDSISIPDLGSIHDILNSAGVPDELARIIGATLQTINAVHAILLNGLTLLGKCTEGQTRLAFCLAVSAIGVAFLVLYIKLDPVSCWGSTGPVARRVSDLFNRFLALTVGCVYMRTWYLVGGNFPTPLYYFTVAISVITLALTILSLAWRIAVGFIALFRKPREHTRESQEAAT